MKYVINIIHKKRYICKSVMQIYRLKYWSWLFGMAGDIQFNHDRPKIGNDPVKENVLFQENGGRVVTWMKGQIRRRADLGINDQGNPVRGIPPEPKGTERTAFEVQELRQNVLRCKGKAGCLQLFADVGSAEGLVGRCEIQIKIRLLPIAQKYIFAEHDIACDKGKRQAVFHGADWCMFMAGVWYMLTVQALQDFFFNRHGRSSLRYRLMQGGAWRW